MDARNHELDQTLPACLREFAQLCSEASARGWHEANGGNLSYRLVEDDLRQWAGHLSNDAAWQRLGHAIPSLAGELVLMTASGAYLHDVEHDPALAAGIIELDGEGGAWRIVWGFDGGARPSSELETHLAAYEVGMQAGDGANRIVYHAHCPQVIALSAVIEADSRTWTRALWKCMTEGIIAFPQGIGVVPWMVPGSQELAQATCELMRDHHVCVWVQHGIMARSASIAKALATIETVEKSAGIYLQARAACAGAEPPNLVTDKQLRAICERYDITPNESYLASSIC